MKYTDNNSFHMTFEVSTEESNNVNLYMYGDADTSFYRYTPTSREQLASIIEDLQVAYANWKD